MRSKEQILSVPVTMPVQLFAEPDGVAQGIEANDMHNVLHAFHKLPEYKSAYWFLNDQANIVNRLTTMLAQLIVLGETRVGYSHRSGWEWEFECRLLAGEVYANDGFGVLVTPEKTRLILQNNIIAELVGAYKFFNWLNK